MKKKDISSVSSIDWNTIFSAIGHPALILDKNHTVIHVNQAVIEATGRSEEELIGKRCYEVFHNSEEAPPHCPMEALLKSQSLESYDMEMAALGGWYLVSCTPVFEDSGELQNIIHIATDITDRKKFENALRESEEKLRNILENSTNLFYSHTTEHIITYLSPQVKNILGYAPEEAIVKWTELASDNPVNEEGFNLTVKAIETGEAQPPYELELIHKNGEKVWVEIREAPMVEKGKTTAIVGALTDITDRKRAEEALRESERLLRQVIDTSPYSIFVKDREGRYILVNKKMAESHKTTPEAMVGKTDISVAVKWLTTPEKIEKFRASEREVIDRKQPLFIEEEKFTFQNGAERWFQTTKIPISLKDNPDCLMGISADITDRKRAEGALQESEMKYRIVVENSLEGIYIIQENHLKFCNQQFADMFGFKTPEKAMGIHIKMLVSEKSWNTVEREVKSRESGSKEISHYEFKARRTDGVEFEAETLGSRMEFQGRPAIQGVIRDVSEQHRLRAQLIQAQKMESIGRLAGGIAHDFNNLLTSIIGNCDLSLNELDEKDPLYENISEIYKSAERASDLTRQLLAFSRKQVLEPKVINLNHTINNMEKMLKRLIGEDIVLETKTNPSLWNVKADPGQVEVVLMNLTVNAKDAMPKGGRLLIETDNVELDEEYSKIRPEIKTGQYVIIAVSDTGAGMTEEIMSQVFDPFFTTKEVGKGTGLGLATVYGIVKQSGGFIYAYAELDKGSTFKIYLPRYEGELEERRVRTEEEALPRGSETILVVEDDVPVLRLAVRILKQLGYIVYDAQTGGDAFLLCEKLGKPIDLVITDVVMPRMSGTELVNRIRKFWKEIKVLYMSGYTPNYIIHEDVLDSGIPYLQKPFRPQDFARKVRGVLDGD